MKALWILIILFVLMSCVRGFETTQDLISEPQSSRNLVSEPDYVDVLHASHPGIAMAPKNISFTDEDWRTNSEKRIYLALDNKQGFCINKATIKMRLPDDWEYIPDINSTIFHYYPTSSKYEIVNFSRTNVAEWFEIKPGPKVSPGTYNLRAEVK